MRSEPRGGGCLRSPSALQATRRDPLGVVCVVAADTPEHAVAYMVADSADGMEDAKTLLQQLAKAGEVHAAILPSLVSVSLC